MTLCSHVKKITVNQNTEKLTQKFERNYKL